MQQLNQGGYMFELFELERCPYCKKVMNFMDENDIKYRKHNIEDKQEEENLIRLGGKRQVPFLYNQKSGLKMYESADIIEYLDSL